MTIYRFSIEVSGIDPNEMGLEDRFYGDGVDDALISVSNGRLVFAFDREATDAESPSIRRERKYSSAAAVLRGWRGTIPERGIPPTKAYR